MIEELRALFERESCAFVETHISWVFLGERDVYKIKKPVDFGFLNFSTLEKRREACEAEVRLNRRLAPDVYLGVIPLTRVDGALARDGEGEPVEYVVHMRRLPDADRLDTRLATGRLDRDDLDRIIERIADFHADLAPDEASARWADPEAIARHVEENFAQTAGAIGAYLSAEEARELRDWQREVLATRSDRFRARAERGRVREGHGDLRLDHVYLDAAGKVRILDCIEFNERFRHADVAADLAFLSMDLAFAGRADLGERVLATYARCTGDYDLYRVIDFYESYRAFVRAKVSGLLADDRGASPAAREKARAQARRYYLLALAKERRSLLPPMLVAVGGPIAAGKSTVALRIADALDAPLLESDRLRKQRAGKAPTEPLDGARFEGAYAESATTDVYQALLEGADAVLASGRPVVIDASFRSASMRASARELAARHGVPFGLVECRVPEETLRARLLAREGQSLVTDARADLLEAFLARYEPFAADEADAVLALDTRDDLDENVRLLERALPFWPRGLVG